jgi:pyruvate,orthophosphate dikinase
MDGSSTPDSLEALKCVHRSCFDKLNEACAAFSKIYDGVVEIEFTIEKGALFFLQVRPVKVSNVLALKLFCKGHKSSFDPDYFSSALSGAKIFIPENQRPVLEGKVVSDGVGIGKPAFSYIDAINFSKKGEDFIFLNPKSSVNFPYDLPHLKGVVFLGGGMTSHGCAIAREFNIPCFVAGGVNKIRFSHNSILLNDIKISKHRPVSLDANNGCLYEDAVRLHNIEEYDFVREFAEAYRERISKDPSKRNEKYDMLLERFEKKG